MSKIKQNLVFVKHFEVGFKAESESGRVGNMYLNRFCIDEDAAFEISGVYNFEETKGK